MKCTIVDDVVWCDVMCCGVNPSTDFVAAFTFFDLAQVFFYEDNASTNRSQYRNSRYV